MDPSPIARLTPQRRAILGVLEDAPGPLTARDVLDLAGRDADGLGLATVYRNLNLLEDSGLIVAVHLPNDTTRYEPAGARHHHHFRCERCDLVFEVAGACPVIPLQGATLPGGFRVERHELTFYGVCRDCREVAHPAGV
jgi:Fur family ferric uptake transcriptional regulator